MDKVKTGVTKQNQDWTDSVNLGADSDSGLGLFDGFFASLSMILVSEVS